MSKAIASRMRKQADRLQVEADKLRGMADSLDPPEKYAGYKTSGKLVVRQGKKFDPSTSSSLSAKVIARKGQPPKRKAGLVNG